MPLSSTSAARLWVRPLVRLACCATLTFFAISLLAGCGPASGDVSGTVSYKGKVVTSGFVTLVGTDGIAKQSEIAEDGSFRVANVPVGEAGIAVASPALDQKYAPRKRPTRVDPETSKPIAGADTSPMGTELQRKTWRRLPPDYADVTKAKLKYIVTSGLNTYEIKIE